MVWNDTLSVLLSQLLALACAWLLASAVINPHTIGAGFYRLQSGLLLLLLLPAIPGTYWAIEYSYPRVGSEWALQRMSLLLAMCAFAGLFNTWRSRMHAARFAQDPLVSGSMRTSLVMAGFWVGLAFVSVAQRQFYKLPEPAFYWTQASLFLGGLLTAALIMLAITSRMCRQNPAVGPQVLLRLIGVAAPAMTLKLISSAVGLGLLVYQTRTTGLDFANLLSTCGLELAGRWLAGLLIPALVLIWLWRLLAKNQRPGAVDLLWLAAACSLVGEWAGARLLLKLPVPV